MNHTGFEKTSLSWKHNTRQRVATRNQHKRRCMFRIPWRCELSPIEFLKGVADKVTEAMCLKSVRRSSNRGSFSMRRSKPIVASVDYYRAAAVEDCIEFMHSSFSRSNSLTATPGEEITYKYSFKKI
ncbi:josephin-like protein [Abrus precatorius]|uniref:Josephin-like protein n=1 Tax=Abrus precatorius TaxID=3816 RepID=A0A8B8K1E6_ABRPR|nr:josephin-like protein [Abrus precatorius]